MFTKKQIFIWGPGPDQRLDAFNEEVLYVCWLPSHLSVCATLRPDSRIYQTKLSLTADRLDTGVD